MVRLWAVHRPEHPSDDTAQLPEPEVPDSLPEAEPWTPLFCRAGLTDPLGPTCPDTLTPEPPARTLPFWTLRVELVPLSHRPPSATNDTLQTPSNLAGSAKADPDASTPALSASAITDFLITDVFLSFIASVLPVFSVICLW